MVALLVALSVAVLPLAGGAAVVLDSVEFSAVEPIHDCCDHGSPCDETSKAVNDCTSMTACAVKCFNYAGTVLPHVVVAPIGSSLHPVRDSGFVASQIGHPPFRPPRA
jgi:hypothetical protein